MEDESRNRYNRHMRVNLSHEWSLEIPEGYQYRKDGDHLIYWRAGITILMTIFAYSGEKHRQTLLANLQAKAEAEKLEMIGEDEGDITRFGYLKPEEVMPGRTRLALHAFTTAPYGCLQTAFYFDLADDMRECLEIWKSVEWTDLS